MLPAGSPMTTGAAVSDLADNPLLQSWETPFGLPPFDRIRPEHFPPAFDRGMEEHAAEIAAIAARPEPRRFREHDRGAGAQRQAADPGRPGVRQSDIERDKRGARRDRPRLRAAPRRAPHPHYARCQRCSPASIRCAGRAIRSDSRPTSSGCSNAIICASCAPGRCSIRTQKARMAAITERLATPAHAVRPERPARRGRVAARARRSRSRRAARIRPRRRRRGGGRARPRRQVRDHPGARLGRAVSDVLGAPRSAPHRLRGLGGARRASGRARQPGR